MKKGGQIKVGVTHVPRLLPPTHYLPKCGLPFIIYLCTVARDLGSPFQPLLCSITSSHATKGCTKDVPLPLEVETT